MIKFKQVINDFLNLETSFCWNILGYLFLFHTFFIQTKLTHSLIQHKL